jgi:mono/diheme cytochrome c family protein
MGAPVAPVFLNHDDRWRHRSMKYRRATLAVLSCIALFGAAAYSSAQGNQLYTVVDGNKVDPQTMKGFRTWRAAACDRCHGPNQEGMVGPSLIESLKKLSKDEFVLTVTKGRLDKGMPSFGENKTVVDNIDQLYAYLKGRSDGAITSAKVQEMP